MSTAATLLARKQHLMERLEQMPGSHERDEIERLLVQIEVALHLLDRAPPESGDER